MKPTSLVKAFKLKNKLERTKLLNKLSPMSSSIITNK